MKRDGSSAGDLLAPVVAPKTGAIGDPGGVRTPDLRRKDECCSFELALPVSYAILKVC